MLLAELVGRMNKRFEISLAPPLFYEHKTLRSFTRFLSAHYGYGSKGDFADAPARNSRPPVAGDAFSGRRVRDVAIVGVSGVFPGSPNLREFWRHLANGTDLIREIPGGRWDWRAYAVDSSGRRKTSGVGWVCRRS